MYHKLCPNVVDTVSTQSIAVARRHKLYTVYMHQVSLATNGVRHKMLQSTECPSIELQNK